MHFISNGMARFCESITSDIPLEVRAPKPLYKNKTIVRAVKLTFIFFLLACLSVSARMSAQHLTISVKNSPLDKLFSEIEQKTGYVFFYDVAILKNTRPVTIDIKEGSVEDVLEAALKGQSLDYSINNKTIFVKKGGKKASVSTIDGEGGPTMVKASGLILDETGQPLSGASIHIIGSGKSFITNAKGEFLIQVPANSTLSFSYIGYETQQLKFNQEKKITIRLKVTTNQLDQVVIQAYGETSQRLATGDIATVTAAEIEKQPVMNPLLALQGRVAGLDIQQTSGYASGPIKAEIRGRSNVDPGTVVEPLYIVDGVPLTVLVLGGSQGGASSFGFLQNPGLTGPANGQSPLFSLNPRDIESITVLKDADATSIYGSRGANGVILITTKKGRVGKTHLDIHVEEGSNTVSRYWKLLNTPQYLEMRREAFRNDGIMPDINSAPDLLAWDTTRYTDWQRALYGRAGRVITTQVALSGGDARTTFRIGANYTHSKEITTANGADQQAAVSFNVTHRSLDQKLTFSLSSTYSFTQSDMIQLPGSVTFAPNAPSIYDSSGKNLNWSSWDSAGGLGSNPFYTLLQPYQSQTDFLNTSFSFGYQPVRGLTFKTNVGYNEGQATQTSLYPISSQDPSQQPTGSSLFGTNSNKNWIIEPQLTYDLPIGNGKLNFLVGGSVQKTTTAGTYTAGSGYTSDALIHTIAAAQSLYSANNYGVYRYASVFGRINYNLSNKYIVNLTARRDGSSNYGPGNQFGNFASVGAGWIFTEEAWMKHHPSFLSFGKLRGSYGTAGSDGGKPYGYLTRWTSNNLLNYSGIQPLIATQHANPNYEWQQNRKLEVGLDLGFFKDWVTIRTSYYRNRTNNQLLNYPTALFTGFASVVSNLPALVQNAGWEFTIGGKGVHSKYFSWAPAINFSINQNKFISFPGLASSPYRNQGRIGQPLNGFYLLHFTGVDPQTGQYTYQDKNHDGMINPNYGPTGDVYFKKISPSFMTGFGFNCDLKGFDVSLFFSVKKQTGVNALAQGQNPGLFNLAGGNQPTAVLGRWQKPGDITSTGKFSTFGAQDPNAFLGVSDLGYTDASYIRIQNLSLSYTLPDTYCKKAGMQSFSIFLHANNLLTITNYKGIDPDIQSFGGLPPTRTLVGGVSVNF
jgi:TonB-linked SusC/RagA family outer membrane protein